MWSNPNTSNFNWLDNEVRSDKYTISIHSLQHQDNTTYTLKSLNSNPNCQQLDRLKEAIAQKWTALANWIEIVFHKDNVGPQTSIMIKQKLVELV